MSEELTAADYLAERCVNTKEIIEGGYASTYNLVGLMEDYAKAKTEELQKEVEYWEKERNDLNEMMSERIDKLKAENEAFKGLLNRILKSGASTHTIKSVIRTELRKTKKT